MMVLLVIMDGWGLAEDNGHNAIAAANTPNYEQLKEKSLYTVIDGAAEAVGLPPGQMGNSEVGHLNLGAGRVVYQDITRIDKSIESGEFYRNDVISAAMERAELEDKGVHLFGLVSDGKVHSSLDHLYALTEMAKRKGVKKLYLHALMDGRDTSPTGGEKYMQQVLRKFDEIGLGKVVTVGGRYYGMDRDKRWQRTNKQFEASLFGKGEKFDDPVAAIKASYDNDVTDEFIVPVVIDQGDSEVGRVREGDVCIMFNFRADRMRQLSYFLAQREIPDHSHEMPRVELITMTNYDKKLYEAKVAFHPVKLEKILGEVLSGQGLKQLRTAETEKYAHVTFFFNGGVEEPFEGEDRDMIPSPKVDTYDHQPEMSSVEVTDNAVEKITSGKYQFILLNYANCDMVGHTGDFDAAKAAAEAVDTGLGRLIEAVESQGGVAIVTADHGNAEVMVDPDDGGPFTAHTTNLVPCLIYDSSGEVKKRFGGDSAKLRDKGILADIAPTVLDILEIKKPEQMTGKSLFVKE